MMKFFAQEIGNIRSKATCEAVMLPQFTWAQENGYKWLNEEEAVAVQLEIPNSSGHFGRITKSRIWNVPTKVADNAIQCLWLGKWRSIREYRVKGKTPSAHVMREVKRTFLLNSGIPVNHDINFVFEK